MEDFAGRLRFFRTQKGLSQEALGKAVGKKPTTVSTWERGDSEPSLDDVAKIAEALGVSAARLAYGLTVEAAPAAPDSGVIDGKPADYRKTGSLPDSQPVAPRAVSSKMQVGEKFQSPGPSSREDVENYFQQYCAAAEASNDPDAFPAIMRLLKKHFPLDEFEPGPKRPK